MPFGYSKKIFPHPAVEYIPIHFRNIKITKDWNYPFQSNESKIYVFSNLKKAVEIIDKYHIPTSRIDQLQDDELLLITFNSQIEDIKYRGYKVTMITSSNRNPVHIFKIKTTYFYKERLYFAIYNQTGKELATKHFTLKN
ncbi:hypothetical protein [Selenihalanaerobacter shriftii]|uniref:Uncharacterized protein n=1 Tax=Selenihalanaerobacter shriftii TaxID=142842 RepID=A0A1T4N6J0_9FIRM|nr:hypothetical protein [Selenihalanaerobacter shriftii]SJZ74783.1 hypothetical protein SAMN02745118_01712 [Selenihalanaerobacter shriftii]